VLVEHIEELEPLPIGRGVELEVHGPDLVKVLGLVTPHRAISQACPLLLAGGGPLRARLATEVVDPIVVHRSAFSPQQAVGNPPTQADVISGDIAEPVPCLGLLSGDNNGRMALASEMLAHQAANPLLGCPVKLLQVRDGPPATLRAKKFPVAPQRAPGNATR
jgi:hypothetical protein